jgi:hypothetical protein
VTKHDRREVIRHPIGPDGVFTLRTVGGSIRVRAAESDDAVVEAHHRSDGARGETPATPLRVTRREGELEIEADGQDGGGMRLGGALGRLIGGHRASLDVDVVVPASATIRIQAVDADIDVSGVTGAQELRTVSGDVRLQGVSGRIAATTVSGDVSVHDGGELSLRATTTSGDVSVRAQSVELLEARTVSGDVDIRAPLRTEQPHQVESVSGDLHLVAGDGLRVEATGFSTTIRADVPHTSERHGPRRVSIVGSGGADVTFRSMSGDVRIHAGRGGARDGDHDEDLQPTADAAPVSHHAAREPDAAPADDTELAILRALELGEIDVDEASRLLERVAADVR